MLYDYVFYVVYKLMGFFDIAAARNAALPLYCRTLTFNYGDVNLNASEVFNRGGTLFARLESLVATDNFWWQFLSDPKLVISTFVYLLCFVITIELCLILPFRWFKRLLRYPNHKLMTPQEVKRSKLK